MIVVREIICLAGDGGDGERCGAVLRLCVLYRYECCWCFSAVECFSACSVLFSRVAFSVLCPYTKST